MLATIVTLMLAAAPAEAAPGLQNAKLTTEAVSGPLAATLDGFVRSAAGPAWIGYAVPTHSDGSMCCWSSIDDAGARCGGCRLEQRKEAFVPRGRDGRPLALEKNGQAHILYRVLQRQIVQVRAYSADCALDAGGVPVRWLTGVSPAESVGYLAALASARAGETARKKEDVAEHALAALAAHAAAEAGPALKRFTAPGQPGELREKAAFWLGTSRGREGYEVLKGLLAAEGDSDFREHVIFALSVNDTPEALDTIIATAKTDRDPEVRAKALFWLGQKAGQKAVATLNDAVDRDPDDEVREKAVFALSQLPDDEGVPHLLRLARTHQSAAVRRKAMFWLGQSGDPRALAYFEEVLAR